MKFIKDYWFLALLILLATTIVLLAPKDTSLAEHKYYCNQIGFDDIYVDETTEPYTYYCLELPALGDIGFVYMIPPDVDYEYSAILGLY